MQPHVKPFEKRNKSTTHSLAQILLWIESWSFHFHSFTFYYFSLLCSCKFCSRFCFRVSFASLFIFVPTHVHFVPFCWYLHALEKRESWNVSKRVQKRDVDNFNVGLCHTYVHIAHQHTKFYLTNGIKKKVRQKQSTIHSKLFSKPKRCYGGKKVSEEIWINTWHFPFEGQTKSHVIFCIRIEAYVDLLPTRYPFKPSM